MDSGLAEKRKRASVVFLGLKVAKSHSGIWIGKHAPHDHLRFMAAKFVNIDRDTRMLFPEDMRDWLPEGHLVHFIVEVVESLDMPAFEVNVRGTDRHLKSSLSRFLRWRRPAK
jgi:hypothetical protein